MHLEDNSIIMKQLKLTKRFPNLLGLAIGNLHLAIIATITRRPAIFECLAMVVRYNLVCIQELKVELISCVKDMLNLVIKYHASNTNALTFISNN